MLAIDKMPCHRTKTYVQPKRGAKKEEKFVNIENENFYGLMNYTVRCTRMYTTTVCVYVCASAPPFKNDGRRG